MVEHLHLNAVDRALMNRHMHEAGYRRAVGTMDTFFYRPELCAIEELDVLALFQNTSLAIFL